VRIVELFGAVEFSLDVLSSIVAVILCGLVTVLVKWIKKIINNTKTFTVYRKSKILYVYDNREDAIRHMFDDAEKSKIIYAITNNANIITDRDNKINSMLRTKRDIKILLNDPDSESAKERDRFLGTEDGYLYHINIVIEKLKKYKDNKNIKYALHDENLPMATYIFNDVLYLFMGAYNAENENSQVWRIGSGSGFYIDIYEYFHILWGIYSEH